MDLRNQIGTLLQVSKILGSTGWVGDVRENCAKNGKPLSKLRVSDAKLSAFFGFCRLLFSGHPSLSHLDCTRFFTSSNGTENFFIPQALNIFNFLVSQHTTEYHFFLLRALILVWGYSFPIQGKFLTPQNLLEPLIKR